MKHPIIIWLTACVILTTLVSAENVSVTIYTPYTYWCFQESANVSTTCGGLSTGNYTDLLSWDANGFWPAIDGLYNTYGRSAGGTAQFFANYSIPPKTVGAIMNFYVGNGSNNYTLTPTEINSSTNQRVKSYIQQTLWDTYILFYDPTTGLPHTITNTPGYIYEESMWWNILANYSLMLSTSYNKFVIEKLNNTIFLQVNSSLLPTSTVNLSYNGTYYPTIATYYPTHTIFQASIYNNSIIGGANPRNISYIFFNYTLYNSNGATYNGSTILLNISQLIYVPIISNCSEANATQIIGFYNYNEVTPTQKVFADWNVNTYIQNSFDSTILNYSRTYPNRQNLTLCTYPFVNLSNYNYNVYLTYNNTIGYTNRYYRFNLSLENKTAGNYSVYSLTTTTLSALILTTLYSTNYQPFPNVITQLNHYYPGEGIFRLVQMDKSSELGNAILRISESTTDYSLTFTDTKNHILKQTGDMRFFCTSGVCEATVYLTPYGETATASIIGSASFNNDSRNITVSYLKPSGESVTAHMTVTSYGTNTVICEDTVIMPAYSWQCHTTAMNGSVMVRISEDGIPRFGQWVTISGTKIGDLLGPTESAILSFFFMISIVLGGVFLHPIAGLIFAVIGVFALSTLGILTFLTTTLLIGTAIFSIIIAVGVRRNG